MNCMRTYPTIRDNSPEIYSLYWVFLKRQARLVDVDKLGIHFTNSTEHFYWLDNTHAYPITRTYCLLSWWSRLKYRTKNKCLNLYHLSLYYYYSLWGNQNE